MCLFVIQITEILADEDGRKMRYKTDPKSPCWRFQLKAEGLKAAVREVNPTSQCGRGHPLGHETNF